MSVKLDERETRIRDLDAWHRAGIHHIDILDRDEEARRLKLQLLSADYDSSSLVDKLHLEEKEYRLLARQFDGVRLELESAYETIHVQDARIKRQSLELTNLKVEVESLQNSIQDSGKAAREGYALSRELDRLRPEMDHLRSQLSNHQAVVAEKHSLQRQLDSLEVELENEKRSRQRTHEKEDKLAVDELKKRAEGAEKRLMVERKERETMTLQHEKTLSDVSGLNERLEGRVSSMKEKIKQLQTELKDTRLQLDQRQTEERETGHTGTAEPRTKRHAPPHRQDTEKRRSEDISFEEITIMTPGNESHRGGQLGKKRGALHAPVGEKSNFSVTPFLNRNRSMTELEESPEVDTSQKAAAAIPGQENTTEPDSEAEKETGAMVESDHEEPQSNISQAAPSQPPSKKPRGRPKAKPLGQASTSKKNSTGPAGSSQTKGVRGDGKVDKTKSTGPHRVTTSTARKPSQPTDSPEIATQPSTMKEQDGTKKKRKLLGAASTIFDDDDGETIPETATVALGPVAKRKRKPLGGTGNAFAGASFSPLRRDKKGVGASFLA